MTNIEFKESPLGQYLWGAYREYIECQPYGFRKGLDFINWLDTFADIPSDIIDPIKSSGIGLCWAGAKIQRLYDYLMSQPTIIINLI